jgi:hypothetical protein
LPFSGGVAVLRRGGKADETDLVIATVLDDDREYPFDDQLVNRRARCGWTAGGWPAAPAACAPPKQ